MVSIIDLYKQLFGRKGIADGNVIDMAEHGRVGGLSTGQSFKHTMDVGSLNIGTFDYVSMALSSGDTTETYTFKTGGSGGTTVATVTVVYTDSTRDILSSATKV